MTRDALMTYLDENFDLDAAIWIRTQTPPLDELLSDSDTDLDREIHASIEHKAAFDAQGAGYIVLGPWERERVQLDSNRVPPQRVYRSSALAIRRKT